LVARFSKKGTRYQSAAGQPSEQEATYKVGSSGCRMAS
jgi:hypothetical protein